MRSPWILNRIKKYVLKTLTDIKTKENNVWKAVKIIHGNSKGHGCPSTMECNHVNKFFATLGEQISAGFGDSLTLWRGPSSTHEFSLEPITQVEVLRHLTHLENKSKADVLGIDSRLLYTARVDVVASLTNIFNISIQRGTIPKEWKRARVTPVYKGKGNKDDSNNYRPISVISFIAKILEKCVQKQLLEYLEYYDFITPEQSAYLKHHST